MNKLDASPPALSLSRLSHSDSSVHLISELPTESDRRLIVLFPASAVDTPVLSNRIWEIARSLKLNVLLLGLFDDFEEEAQLRRKLITMASIIKDPSVSTEIMIKQGNDWVGQVRNIWRTGDTVACFSGQKIGFMSKPLDQILRSSLKAPIYILADYQPVRSPNSTFISQVSSWLGSLAIIGGFLWVEVRIVQLPQDWAHTALIYACILVEVFLIFLWNSLFS